MKQAIFYIALPGAGKTTHIKNNYPKWNSISADDLKESHSEYDPENAHVLHEWSVTESKKMVLDTIKTDEDFVFDSGGINNTYSINIIRKTKEAGYNIKLIHIDTPLYECLNRVNKRERKVPNDNIFSKAFKLTECLHQQMVYVDDFEKVTYYENTDIFLDMDGTLVGYECYPLKTKLAPENICADYINNNMFEYLKPVKPMINALMNLPVGTNFYILSVSPNSETDKQKRAWLKKHFNVVPDNNIYFVGNGDRKVTTLKQIMEKRKLSNRNVLYIDDLHTMIWGAVNEGINAMHPSKFLSEFE